LHRDTAGLRQGPKENQRLNRAEFVLVGQNLFAIHWVTAVANENDKEPLIPDSHARWVKERGRAKTLWVVAVMAFWVTALIMAVLYYLESKVDLILASIALGLMILGLWLKTRYQLIARKQPEASTAELANGQDHNPGA
jgi:hypothetical protein